MKFELWSFWHYLYIASPFVLTIIGYLVMRYKSDKTKRIVGIIIGIISILILVTRNIDIYNRSGWTKEVIPLQVCHFGNIIVGLALITKWKPLLLVGFCFNLIPAFSSLVYADSLVNYATLAAIRPQAYIWGHLFIVCGSLYGLLIYKPKVSKKDALIGAGLVLILLDISIICNSLFRYLFDWPANYFYVYDSSGVPFKFIYDWGTVSTYGWLKINWIYLLVLASIFTLAYFGMFKLMQFVGRDNSLKPKALINKNDTEKKKSKIKKNKVFAKK